MTKYEYEINFDSKKETIDEWGAAFLWLDDDRGVEYNLCYDGGECYSAIYKVDASGEYSETDTNAFIHYEIDFTDVNWKEKFVDAMERAAIELWKGDN